MSALWFMGDVRTGGFEALGDDWGTWVAATPAGAAADRLCACS